VLAFARSDGLTPWVHHLDTLCSSGIRGITFHVEVSIEQRTQCLRIEVRPKNCPKGSFASTRFSMSASIPIATVLRAFQKCRDVPTAEVGYG
jgi:hypothetical protein